MAPKSIHFRTIKYQTLCGTVSFFATDVKYKVTCCECKRLLTEPIKLKKP